MLDKMKFNNSNDDNFEENRFKTGEKIILLIMNILNFQIINT
jgi:hypothetical protein